MYNPLVSVIIPVFNSLNFISEAIESVLYQTYKNIEIIIIDDGSNDGTYELLIEKYSANEKINVLTHELRLNKGVNQSRRLGVNFSNGEFLAFLDADDIFEKNKIECQLNIMKNNIDVVLVHSKVHFINEIDNSDIYFDFSFASKSIKYEINLQKFINANHICNSTVLVRKNKFSKVNLIINQGFQYEDWIQWIILSEHGKFFYLNESTTSYRYHSQSSSSLLNKNNILKYYANLEKNIILEKEFRGKKTHLFFLNNLSLSMNDIYFNLLGSNHNPKVSVFGFYIKYIFYKFIRKLF